VLRRVATHARAVNVESNVLSMTMVSRESMLVVSVCNREPKLAMTMLCRVSVNALTILCGISLLAVAVLSWESVMFSVAMLLVGMLRTAMLGREPKFFMSMLSDHIMLREERNFSYIFMNSMSSLLMSSSRSLITVSVYLVPIGVLTFRKVMLNSMLVVIDRSMFIVMGRSVFIVIDRSVCIVVDRSMFIVIDRSVCIVVDRSMFVVIDRSVCIVVDRSMLSVVGRSVFTSNLVVVVVTIFMVTFFVVMLLRAMVNLWLLVALVAFVLLLIVSLHMVGCVLVVTCHFKAMCMLVWRLLEYFLLPETDIFLLRDNRLLRLLLLCSDSKLC